MAVLTNSEEDELVVICSCGCDEGIHIKLDYDKDFDDYALMAFTNGNFYKEQGHTISKNSRRSGQLFAIKISITQISV